MIIHLKYLLSQLAEFPDRHYSKIGLLSGQEYDQTIRRWNETYCALPLNKSIHHLIAEHVSKRPQAIAVSHNGLHLTYQQLEDRSNQLAHLLVNKFGIADEEIIPVVLERSCELLISLLAILKAGGAYLPLDPMLPVERKLMILKDCSATVMIGAASLLDLDRQWAATNIENLILFQSEVSIDFQRNFEVPFDDRATGGSQKLFFDGACHLMRAARRIFTESDINEQSASAINKHYPGNQLAYVIYTSGSTGLPKGAMIERNGMLNHLYAKVNSLKMTESTVMAQTSSQSFDVSIWQFLSPLLAGGKVIIYDNDVILDSVRLAREFHRDQVDIFEVVPSYLASFLEEVHEKGLSSLLGGLRYLIVNGEVFPPALAARWFEFCPNVPLINAYGPTEASDDISQHVMSSVPETHRIPLGKVLQNLSVYVVGKDMSLCPVGVKGEITIAGIGVGRGYLNNPKLTSHKFIENPFGEPGSRLYRTGDWGRWLADGTLDYLGREDDQVKVRGYRIELAEIEQALLKIPGIRQSCVVVRHRKDRDETNKYIVGYYIPDGNMSLPESVILEELSKAVPDYMIPSALVELSTFPLTTSGKLNKNSLPDPDFKSGAEFVPPITQAERMVSDIWKQALSVDRVGLGDDFFRIGGNSILAIHVSHRMSKALGVDIKVADLFRSKNISKLLHNIHTPQSTESNVLLRL
jgi:amino acid adenylation domain-containing protein